MVWLKYNVHSFPNLILYGFLRFSIYHDGETRAHYCGLQKNCCGYEEQDTCCPHNPLKDIFMVCDL